MVKIIRSKGVSAVGSVTASLGKSRVVGRLLETDKDTRGSRSDRKWRVENMLPATTAIINVYQLEDKWKRGGSREKKQLGRGAPVREVREEIPRTSTISGSGRGARPPREESTEISPAFSNRKYFTSGIRKGDLVPVKNETDAQYRKSNAEHRNKMMELRQKAEEAVQEKTEKAQQEYATKIQQDVKGSEEALKAQRREDPIAALGTLAKRSGVKTETNEGRWANNTGYRRYDPSKPSDRITIEKAITYARDEGLLNTVPPAVVGVPRVLNGTPKSYYILNDLQWYNQRRRKKTKHPMTRRTPVTNGKKRVVKRKGGKK